jgi:hypothetical protein
MKKIYCLLLCLFFFTPSLFSQIAYYDAKKILDECSDTTGQRLKFIPARKSELAGILKAYLPAIDQRDSLPNSVIFNKCFSNPFIGWDLTAVNKASGATWSGNLDRGFSFTGLLSSVGGLDVTNLANGVAQLMIDRAKQELTIRFFNKFQQFMDENPEAQSLFPKTKEVFLHLLSYQYPAMLPAMQTAFFDDLKGLPMHIDDLLELDRYKELLRTMPEVRVAIHSLGIVQDLTTGKYNTAEVIAAFSQLAEWNDLHASATIKNMGNAISTAAVFSQSLLNDPAVSGNNSTWIKGDELKTLTRDTILFRIYMGLVWQEINTKNIQFVVDSNIIRADTVIARQRDNLLFFSTIVSDLGESGIQVDKIRTDLEKKKADTSSFAKALTNDDYYSYVNAAIDVIDNAFAIAGKFDNRINVTEYTAMARTANNLYRDIYRQNYSDAVLNTVTMLNSISLLVKHSDQVETVITMINNDAAGAQLGIRSLKDVGDKKIADMTVLINHGAPIGPSLRALIAYYYAQKLGTVMDKVKDYGLFMANIVNAKTPDDVEAALNNAILPVGSSSIKKNTTFNISIQSYLGVFARLNNAKPGLNIAWNDAWGVTAPIGINFSWGLHGKGSISAFGSLFDLGAIVDYRLKQDSVANGSGQQTAVTEKDYKVELGQLFSPGIHVVYGLPWNWPISIGVGGQYGPGLSKISGGQAVINNPYWRWNAFVAVDLPFFNLVSVK